MNTLYLLFYLLALVSFCVGTFLGFSRRPTSLAIPFISLGLALVTLVEVMKLWP
jgi:hypothetical protein